MRKVEIEMVVIPCVMTKSIFTTRKNGIALQKRYRRTEYARKVAMFFIKDAA